jgi:outer membrane cobalamin receptor
MDRQMGLGRSFDFSWRSAKIQFVVAFSVIILFAASSTVLAQTAANAPRPSTQPATAEAPDLSGGEMPAASAPKGSGGESELLEFQDLPIVVSSSRQAQPINQASESIGVISADDIHYSARTTLPEILQFTPGVDVVKLDRNDYALGVLGLHGSLADRTLTLIDGRDAGTPAYGGADFLALPIFNEDIERIEVVRGPGGAAWGADALNGVINIITKPLDKTLGLLVSSTVDEYGDVDTQLRWGAQSGPWAWRVSAGYVDRQSSQQILGDNVNFEEPAGSSGFLASNISDSTGDSLQNVKVDAEGQYRISDQSKLTVGVADGTERRGSYEFLGELPPGYTYIEVVRDFARLDFDPSSSESGDFQVYNNYENSDAPSVGESQTDETDLETQFNFTENKQNKLTIGGNARDMYSNFPSEQPTDLLAGHFSEFTGGVFLIDRLQVNQRLAVEGQIRGDYYSESGADWSGRLTGLYSLDDDQRNVLRLSLARAFRTPLAGILGFSGSRLPLPPPYPAGTDVFNIDANPNLDNEHVYAVEAGYDGQLAQGVLFRVDPFYQQYQGLIGGTTGPTPPGALGDYVQLQNISGGEAYGVNMDLECTIKDVTLMPWYSLDQFLTEHRGQDIRSFAPPLHSAGLNARWAIGDGWTLSGNYKFTDVTETPGDGGDSFSTAPATNQVDLFLSKTLFDGAGEVSVGVADLFDQTRDGVAEIGRFTTHDTPGRTVLARFQWHW